jgi:UDP-N-acetylglucosamine--N-acetylmuramyl-(pentapeptide) pyrophosphoryl-undecaprenol N-acetylglucosamine transferase
MNAALNALQRPCALIMAGGTGGHIFPGLAVAKDLQAKGWRVHWLGAPASMEQRLVPSYGIPMELVAFSGVRGKGLKTMAYAPFKLLKAVWQAKRIVQRVKPNVVIGLGGFITVPGALAAKWCGVPVLLHEQNAIAGMANRYLSYIAKRVFTAFPNVLKRGEWIGNPMRAEFMLQLPPEQRFANRSGALKVLVLGGSLGAQALNETVPAALALLPEHQRAQVVHQSGAKHIDALRDAYYNAGVAADLRPFIDDVATAMADADVVICRSGASTVSELSAVGVPALLVPFPFAVDDHQTANAEFLTASSAAWLVQQRDLSPQGLADWLAGLTREQLLACALKASALAQTNAAHVMVQAAQEECV